MAAAGRHRIYVRCDTLWVRQKNQIYALGISSVCFGRQCDAVCYDNWVCVVKYIRYSELLLILPCVIINIGGYMKNRLYKSHVLDGEKRMAEYAKQLKRDFWKHLFINIVLFLLVILAILAIALITKQTLITNIICTPIAVRFLLPRFASNFFELAVAVAIALFGTTSPAALATTVGVLTEVPVMLMLVRIANKTKERF